MRIDGAGKDGGEDRDEEANGRKDSRCDIEKVELRSGLNEARLVRAARSRSEYCAYRREKSRNQIDQTRKHDYNAASQSRVCGTQVHMRGPQR